VDLPNVPRRVLGLTWREHIGGRWAVSAVGFAVTAPIAFHAVFINVQVFNPNELALWALASGSSLAVLGLLWWLASATVLNNRRTSPAPIVVVVLVGFLAGAIRSLIATTLTVELGLFPAPNGLGALLPARAAVGGIQGALGLPVLAMTLSLISRYRNERARLLMQLASVQQKRSEEAGAVQALRDALSGPVQTRLRELADRLGEDVSQISHIASDVRTQAHDLWSQTQEVGDPPRIRAWDVIRISLSVRPLPLSAIWVIWVPSAVLTLVARNGIGVALSQVLIGAVILSGVYLLGARVVQRFPRMGVLVLLAGTAIGGILSGLAMLVMVGGSLSDANMALIVVSTSWLLSVTLLVSLVEAAVRRSQQVLNEIESTIDADELALYSEQRARTELAHEVAGVLHGVVQGRLAIAQRSDSDSTALARQALDEGIERLAGPVVVGTSTAREVAEQVSAPWSALMEIDIAASEGELSGSQVRDVSDVLEECLSNAFRHGQATFVTISVQRVTDGWDLRIVSNGMSPSSDAVSGMGSSLFDSVSGGNWSRTAVDEGGCLVSVVVAGS